MGSVVSASRSDTSDLCGTCFQAQCSAHVQSQTRPCRRRRLAHRCSAAARDVTKHPSPARRAKVSGHAQRQSKHTQHACHHGRPSIWRSVLAQTGARLASQAVCACQSGRAWNRAGGAAPESAQRRHSAPGDIDEADGRWQDRRTYQHSRVHPHQPHAKWIHKGTLMSRLYRRN
jgi:hypothetical protein